MIKYKIKEILLKPGFAAGISALVSAGLTLAITIPLVSKEGTHRGDIVAFNRNSNSGTRAAFGETMNILEGATYSKNVIEVSGSAPMESNVINNKNSIGYTSVIQLVDFDSTDLTKWSTKNPETLVLNLNGVEPSKKNIQDGKYNAGRNFNTFFRVNSNQVSDWNFVNDAGTWKFIVPTSKDGYGENLDDAKIGWALHNYLLYSEEVTRVTELPVNNGSVRVDFTNDVDWNTLKLNSDEWKNKQFYTVGSSSVKKVLEDAILIEGNTSNPNDTFIGVMNNAGINNFIIEIAHAGSGDAFRQDLAQDAYNGFLSREVKTEEIINWGYNSLQDLIDTTTYQDFQKDSIVMFVNKDNPYYSQFTEQKYLNITKTITNLIYTNGTLDWNDLNSIL